MLNCNEDIILSRQEDGSEISVVKLTGLEYQYTSMCRMFSMHQIRVEYLQSNNFHQLSGDRLLSVVRVFWDNL